MFDAILIIIMLLLPVFAPCQCPIGVDAGPDQYTCFPPTQVTLEGSIIGDYLNFMWSPLAGMGGANTLTPTVNTSTTADYVLSATAYSGNLIANGDFEQGNTGFNSDYQFYANGSGGLGNGGFEINTQPSYNGYTPANDHTSGSGNFMIIDGSSNLNQMVWCQNVPVTPNTNYVLSAWVTTLCLTPPYASLEFSINGMQVGAIFSAPSNNSIWLQFNATWNSGSNAIANICIENLDLLDPNNVFGLDDISFSGFCTVTDTVSVNVIHVSAVAYPLAGIIPCTGAEMTLNGTGSSTGPEISYVWDTPNGNIVSDAYTLTPIVNQAGDYILTVIYDFGNGQCADQATVSVIESPNTLQAWTDTPPPLGNGNNLDTLNGYANQGNVSFQWTTSDGHILSGAGSSSAVVDQPGIYTLVATSLLTGCSDTVQVGVAAVSGTCPIDVDAGPDQFTCYPPNPVTLNGSIDGSYLSFAWSPSSGMGGANTLMPTVNTSTTADYVLSATAYSGNLIANGDFEQGNTGFTSDYLYSPNPSGGLSCSTYEINTTPSYWGNAQCNDHTSGSSNFMICAGAFTSGENIWCQSVSVTPNTNYFLSAWTTSLFVNPPFGILIFRINGVQVGADFPVPSQNCNWIQFSAVWNSGSNTTADICIKNTVLCPFNNIFGLDDISLRGFCTESDTVTVNVIHVNAITQPAVSIIPCNGAEINLSGTGSSTGPEISYSWDTSDGNIVFGDNTVNPTVNEAGNYILTVQYDYGSGYCEDQATVNVLESPNPLQAWTDIAQALGCGADTVALNGYANAGNVSFQWTTLNGHIVSGTNSSTALADQAGNYRLIVTDTITGCMDTATVSITLVANPPVAQAAAGGVITCAQTTAVLSGAGSSMGAGIGYAWNSPDGVVASGQDSILALAAAPGMYMLMVVDSSNNCIVSDTVQISADSLAPAVAVQASGVFNCAVDTLWLSALLNPAGSTAVWITPSGDTLGGTSIQAVMAGIYLLTVTDTANGCTAALQDTLLSDYIPPIVQVQQPDTIDCVQNSVELNGSGSSTGSNFSYAWSGPGILPGADSLAVQANAPGNYVLTVLNAANGCTASYTVPVIGNTIPVSALASAPDTLDCSTNSVVLSSAGSSAGSDISYLWSTVDGQIDSGAGTASPSVSLPGQYTLLVSNDANGCTASTTATVLQDTTAPTTNIAPPGTITCAVQSLSLQAVPGNYSYNWSASPGGLILSGQNTPTPAIGAPGTYTLALTGLSNGCTAMQNVTVTADTTAPLAQAAATGMITCVVDSMMLSSTGSSSGLAIQYLWTASAGGNILSGAGGPSPLVDASGVYLLLITDSANGCTAAASVSVLADIQAPAIALLPVDSLSCSVLTDTIFVSNPDPAYTWFWQTTDGTISGGEQTPAVLIAAPGTYTVMAANPANGCTALASQTVYNDAGAPTAFIAAPGTLTCAVTQLSLPGSGSTGPQFTYAWSGGNILSGDSTLSPVIDAPGVYTLTVNNTANGCTAQDSVTITQDFTAPAVNIAPPTTITCAVPSVILNGAPSGPGYAYLWQGSIQGDPAQSSVTVNMPGLYSLTVTSQANGCTGSTGVAVQADLTPPGVSITPLGTLTCVQTSEMLSAAVSPAGSLLSWSTNDGNITEGANTLSPTIDAPGLYQIIAENVQNGCKDTAVVTVTENIQAPVAVAVAVATLSCSVQQLVLDGTASSPGVNFIWTGPGILSGASSATPLINQPGDYNLQVTDPANGCTATDDVQVFIDTLAPSVFIANASPITCVQTLVTLDAGGSDFGPGFNLSWSTSNGQFSSGQNTLTPTVVKAGNYAIMVTDTSNGCSAIASVTVQENTVPPQAEAGPPELLHCNTLAVSLQGSAQPAAVQYAWQTQGAVNIVSGATTPGPLVDAPGVYTLTVTRIDNGCTAVDSTWVEQVQPPVFEAQIDQPDCLHPEGVIQIAVISGSTPLEYSFDGGNLFQQVSSVAHLNPGAYQLAVRDQYGCSAMQEVWVDSVQYPAVSLPVEITVPLGDGAIIVPLTYPEPAQIAQWVWSPPEGLSCADCYQPTITTTSAQTYNLTITDAGGCTAAASVRVLVDRTRYVYAPNVFSPNGDGVNDYFTIFGRHIREIQQMQLFDRWGELLWEGTHLPANQESVGWDGGFRGRQVLPGVYVWQAIIVFEDGEILKQHGEATVVR